MHSFQKIVPDFATFHQLCTCIQDKRIFIQIWDIFCGACSQWKKLALVMRKCLPFLIIDANSPIKGEVSPNNNVDWVSRKQF